MLLLPRTPLPIRQLTLKGPQLILIQNNLSSPTLYLGPHLRRLTARILDIHAVDLNATRGTSCVASDRNSLISSILEPSLFSWSKRCTIRMDLRKLLS
jgi:hypothetical protein